MKAKVFLGCEILILLIALVGCAAGPPIKNPQVSKSNLPQKHFIENVPIYRQPYMDCGPTSLRMVLNFYGKSLSADEVGKARWGGRGTSVSGIESFARSQGFNVYAFFDSKKEEMRHLLTQGYPLIVLGIPPPEWYKSGRYSGEGHYVVAVGYDDLKKIFIINDPGPGRKIEIPYDTFRDFHRSHQTHCNYVLCVYPKGK